MTLLERKKNFGKHQVILIGDYERFSAITSYRLTHTAGDSASVSGGNFEGSIRQVFISCWGNVTLPAGTLVHTVDYIVSFFVGLTVSRYGSLI